MLLKELPDSTGQAEESFHGSGLRSEKGEVNLLQQEVRRLFTSRDLWKQVQENV